MKFSSTEQVAIAREIGLTLAKRFDARPASHGQI